MMPAWKKSLAALIVSSAALSAVFGCELLDKLEAKDKAGNTNIADIYREAHAKFRAPGYWREFYKSTLDLGYGLYDKIFGNQTLGPGRAAPLPPSAQAKFLLSKALQEIYNNKLEQAQQDLNAALKLEPDSAFIHFKHAELCAMQAKYDPAIQEANRAISLAPAWKDPYYFLVEIFLLSRRPQDAESMAKKLLEMDPEDGLAVIQLSRTYQAQQLVGPSILVLEEFLESYPDQVDVRRELARLLSRLGRYDESEAAYKELLAMVANDPSLWEEYAQVQIVRGNLEGAAATYQKELEIIPSDYLTRLELAKIFLRLGKKDLARKQVDIARGFASVKSEVWEMSAELYIQERNYESARQDYLELIKIEPKNLHAIYNLGLIAAELKDWPGAQKWFSQVPKNSELAMDAQVQVIWMLYNQGKKDQAIEAARALVKEHPGKKLTWLTLAGIFQKEEKYQEAIDLLNSSLKSIPEDVDLLYSLAMVYSLTGDDNKAIETGQLALVKKPEDPALLNFIGYTLLDSGADLDRAEEFIRRALAKEPENAAIIDSMAWVYYQKGQYREALKLLNQALEKIPDDPEISKHLGQVWVKLGDKKKAGEYFDKALALNPRSALKNEIEGLSKEIK